MASTLPLIISFILVTLVSSQTLPCDTVYKLKKLDYACEDICKVVIEGGLTCPNSGCECQIASSEPTCEYIISLEPESSLEPYCKDICNLYPDRTCPNSGCACLRGDDTAISSGSTAGCDYLAGLEQNGWPCVHICFYGHQQQLSCPDSNCPCIRAPVPESPALNCNTLAAFENSHNSEDLDLDYCQGMCAMFGNQEIKCPNSICPCISGEGSLGLSPGVQPLNCDLLIANEQHFNPDHINYFDADKYCEFICRRYGNDDIKCPNSVCRCVGGTGALNIRGSAESRFCNLLAEFEHSRGDQIDEYDCYFMCRLGNDEHYTCPNSICSCFRGDDITEPSESRGLTCEEIHALEPEPHGGSEHKEFCMDMCRFVPDLRCSNIDCACFRGDDITQVTEYWESSRSSGTSGVSLCEILIKMEPSPSEENFAIKLEDHCSLYCGKFPDFSCPNSRCSCFRGDDITQSSKNDEMTTNTEPKQRVSLCDELLAIEPQVSDEHFDSLFQNYCKDICAAYTDIICPNSRCDCLRNTHFISLNPVHESECFWVKICNVIRDDSSKKHNDDANDDAIDESGGWTHMCTVRRVDECYSIINSPGMTEFCKANCYRDPPYCPPQLCTCSDDQQPRLFTMDY